MPPLLPAPLAHVHGVRHERGVHAARSGGEEEAVAVVVMVRIVRRCVRRRREGQRDNAGCVHRLTARTAGIARGGPGKSTPHDAAAILHGGEEGDGGDDEDDDA
jgi:hypothetical protein